MAFTGGRVLGEARGLYGLQMVCQPLCPCALSWKKSWASRRPSGDCGLEFTRPHASRDYGRFNDCVCSMPSHGARLVYRRSLNINVQTTAQVLRPGWPSTWGTTNTTTMAPRTGTATSHSTAKGMPTNFPGVGLLIHRVSQCLLGA